MTFVIVTQEENDLRKVISLLFVITKCKGKYLVLLKDRSVQYVVEIEQSQFLGDKKVDLYRIILQWDLFGLFSTGQ